MWGTPGAGQVVHEPGRRWGGGGGISAPACPDMDDCCAALSSARARAALPGEGGAGGGRSIYHCPPWECLCVDLPSPRPLPVSSKQHPCTSQVSPPLSRAPPSPWTACPPAQLAPPILPPPPPLPLLPPQPTGCCLQHPGRQRGAGADCRAGRQPGGDGSLCRVTGAGLRRVLQVCGFRAGAHTWTPVDMESRFHLVSTGLHTPTSRHPPR